MGFLEALGDVTIRLFHRLSYSLLGLLLALLRLANRADLYPFFEKRGVDRKDYAVLKAQVAAALFLFAAVSFLFGLLRLRSFLLLSLPLGAYVLYLLSFPLRRHYARDFPAYRDFFLFYLGFPLLLLGVDRSLPSSGSLYPYRDLLAASVLFVLLFLAYFRLRYGRDYTFGEVRRAGRVLEVKTHYDIRANVKPRLYTFENLWEAEVGDEVKLSVERGLFSLTGSRVTGILEVSR
jgi:uncharacterized membrane protein